jgi:DNA primase small subunit
VRRELVFDLDLTDYEFLTLETPEGDVDAEACDQAWCVCAVGIFVLQRLLKNAFGFEEFVVVYSGRRGAHLYVCDDKAMNLSDDVRAAITDFFKFVPSNDTQRAHPSTRAVMVMYDLSEALHHIFTTHFIDELGLFDTPSQRVAFVERLGFSEEYLPTVSNLAEDVLDESMSGRDMWEFLKTKVASLPQEWMRDRIDDMMLTFVWPRIDAGVSRHLNHLLKAPFVSHPKTGRIAVPVNAVDYFRFEPGNAPRRDAIVGGHPFEPHESVRWLHPCHVDETVTAPNKKKAASNKKAPKGENQKQKQKQKQKHKQKTQKKPKMAVEVRKGQMVVVQDVDMEDLAGPVL